jgi:acetyl-CoA carboxylase biotin carboxyl carrier protein
MNNLDDILKLLHAMAALPFESMEVSSDGVTVRVSRGTRPAGGAQASSAPAQQAADLRLEPKAGPLPDKTVAVASPIIGMFYSAPSPDDTPYVSEGSAVQAGQTLCIVEAMKLMNEIPSPVTGTVIKVLAQDGGEVEVGQTLFLIEPAEA